LSPKRFLGEFSAILLEIGRFASEFGLVTSITEL
jgi:hypothetical protein